MFCRVYLASPRAVLKDGSRQTRGLLLAGSKGEDKEGMGVVTWKDIVLGSQQMQAGPEQLRGRHLQIRKEADGQVLCSRLCDKAGLPRNRYRGQGCEQDAGPGGGQSFAHSKPVSLSTTKSRNNNEAITLRDHRRVRGLWGVRLSTTSGMEAGSFSLQPRGGCGWEGKPREAKELVQRLTGRATGCVTSTDGQTQGRDRHEEEQGSFSQRDPLWDVMAPPQTSGF